MIKRDRYGIVVQHGADDYADGGDSASRTGILALCGSMQDLNNIGLFFTGKDKLVRHPAQSPWTNPKNFTRDQLIPLAVGLWYSSKQFRFTHARERSLRIYFHKILLRGGFCFNTDYDDYGTGKKFPDLPDWLAPDQVGALIIASKSYWLYWALPVCYTWHLLALVWNCTKGRNKEQNQFWCTTFPYRTTPLYIKLYGWDNFKTHMLNYWGGWRDQVEIGRAILNKTRGRNWQDQGYLS